LTVAAQSQTVEVNQDAYPSLENITEMKVTALNNNAEFAQIGVVTFVTESGTNNLHGSAFEYFQNSALNANVLNVSVKARAPQTFHTFGGSLGGPVTIPSSTTEATGPFLRRLRGKPENAVYPERYQLPTVAERSGNLNGLVQGLGPPFGTAKAWQGTRVPERSNWRLDPQHGYDRSNRPLANAYNTGSRHQSNTDMIVRNTGGVIARPDCVGNTYAGQTNQNFFNLNAFAVPPQGAGRFGNCGVGILQGPGMIDVDAGLAKRFNIGERFHARFEATLTNVLNHTNFAPPALNIGNPASFGVLQASLPQVPAAIVPDNLLCGSTFDDRSREQR